MTIIENQLQMPDISLSEDQYNEVLSAANFYRKEAKRCKKGKAYLAGCVMIGSALESLLLAFAECYYEEAANSKHAPKKKNVVRPLIEWDLWNLLSVAKDLNWLPAGLSLEDQWDDAKAKIGDYGEVVRKVRNLVHPARYIQDMGQLKLDKKYLESMFDVMYAANDYLLVRLNKSLKIYLNEQNARKKAKKEPQVKFYH